MEQKIIDWQEVLGWGPDQINDMKFFAFSYLKQGKYDIALKIFLGIKVLAPNDNYVIKTLGSLYLVLNQAETALTYLEKAFKEEPKNSKIHLNIVQAMLDLGRNKEALEEAKKLSSTKDKAIAGKAKALIMAWG